MNDRPSRDLRSTLALVNEWLRFAEAKNGALVVASLGVAVALLQMDPSTDGYLRIPPWYARFMLAQLLLATGAALGSFLPRTNIGRLLPKGAKKETDNLFFFAHIAKYSPKFYLKALTEDLAVREEKPSRSELGLAEQIVVNARIANWKFMCSTWAIRFLMSALFTPVVAFLAEYLLNRRHGLDAEA